MITFVSPLWCVHGRDPRGCEDCQLVRALERGYIAPDRVTVPAPPAPVLAEVDLHIDRGDRATFVAAGDPIPPALVDLPRVPVARPTVEKPRRRGRPAAAVEQEPAAQ